MGTARMKSTKRRLKAIREERLWKEAKLVLNEEVPLGLAIACSYHPPESVLPEIDMNLLTNLT